MYLTVKWLIWISITFDHSIIILSEGRERGCVRNFYRYLFGHLVYLVVLFKLSKFYSRLFGAGGGGTIFACFWIAEEKVEGSIVIRPLEKASKAVTLNDESFFGRVDRTKENSSREDKGWAIKRAHPSQKVWYSELGLLEKISPVFKFGQGLLCGFSIRHCCHWIIAAWGVFLHFFLVVSLLRWLYQLYFRSITHHWRCTCEKKKTTIIKTCLKTRSKSSSMAKRKDSRWYIDDRCIL